MMKMRPLWGPHKRLKKSSEFRRVQGQGRKFRQSSLLFLSLPAQTASSRIGLTVSRKVGNAVVRNRVKRLLREALRHEVLKLRGSWDVVVVAHPSASSCSQSSISKQVNAFVSGFDTASKGDQ